MADGPDFNRLDEPIGEPRSVMLGVPGEMGVRIDGESNRVTYGNLSLGKDRHKIPGDIAVDSSESIKEGLFGSPIRLYDNPLGTVPSTIFTPTAAKLITFDAELLELGRLASAMGMGI